MDVSVPILIGISVLLACATVWFAFSRQHVEVIKTVTEIDPELENRLAVYDNALHKIANEVKSIKEAREIAESVLK